jgi:hypothetical protein
MTALTAPARREEEARLRPVPWRRMAWVTWRQHRIALTGAAVFLGGLAVCLWLVGLQVHHAYAAAATCHPASSLVCGELAKRFSNTDNFLANGSVLQAVPALIGAFAGAPVLARELETGTFRYAWTQGFSRWRWTLAKLVMIAVVLAAAAGALSVLLAWYYQPYFATRNQARFLTEASPLAATLFDLRGIAFAAWTLAAFAIGALAGMLIRRVVAAIIATLAAYSGLALAAGLYLRGHYLTALITGTQGVPGSAEITSQWGTRGGTFVFAGQPPLSLLQRVCPGPPSGTRGPANPDKLVTIAQCLSQHGYTWWASYQPASRFWPFQWIEAGWLLALSALLISATVGLVRRRAA